MKIIIINDYSFIEGGAGKVAIESLIEMKRRNKDVTFITCTDLIDQRIIKAKIKTICLNQKPLSKDNNRMFAAMRGLWNQKAYKTLCDVFSKCNQKETIIHIHSWTRALSPSILVAIRMYKMKVIITLHDFFLFCSNGALFNYPKNRICDKTPCSLGCYFSNCDRRCYPHKLWRSLRQVIQNRLVARNKHLYLFSISDLTDKIFRNAQQQYSFIKNAKIIRVNNPIEISNKKIAEIQNNKKYLFMSRLDIEKGLDLFCEAISQLHLEGIVVGDGSLYNEYKSKYPNIDFVGWKAGKEKDEYIMQCKALIFPSYWYECAPLTISEIQSYGLPCIVPNQCAAAEQIKDGETGFIFKTGDLESLKEAICKLEKVDLVQMQKNVLESFHPEKKSVEHHVDKLLEVYREILEENDK